MTFRGLSELRKAECRHAARNILRRFNIRDPKYIDLVTIAWRIGRLRIKDGGLDSAAGRLVACSEGGVIRVAPTSSVGRYRFTVAHEIGHFVLHLKDAIERSDSNREFTIWNDASEEAEANCFAAELLMPEYFFKPAIKEQHPSFAHLSSIADRFQTSLLATAFHFCEYTDEPIALVLSDGRKMRSFRPFADGEPRLRYGEIDPDSGAAELYLEGERGPTGMERTPAYAWLEGYERRPEIDVWEDSICQESQDLILSLIWLKNPV